MGKIAIIAVVIIAVFIVSIIFATQHSSGPEANSQENPAMAGSEGRHLTLDLKEEVNVKSTP